MKITKYRMDQLDEARRIQKDCIEQHLPCPPVAWWQAKIIDSNNKVEEQIESKCNSYTRNGLNLIASNSMYLNPSLISTTFGDGLISYKLINGTMYNSLGYWVGPLYSGYGQVPYLVLGDSANVENIDAFEIGSIQTISATGTIISSVFDNASRKLTNTFQRSFVNDSALDFNATESGIIISIYTVNNNGNANGQSKCLVVRDVFSSPITIPVGKSLVFSYNFELLYPE